LHDAIASVERAAYKIHNATLSPRWYSWLYETEMRVCLEVAREARDSDHVTMHFARCRDRSTLEEWYLAALDRLLDVISYDPVRLARAVRLTSEFLELRRTDHAGTTLTDIERQLAVANQGLTAARSLLGDAQPNDPYGAEVRAFTLELERAG
jgi:hypothetical protein